jgi:hypothetical protein
MGTVPAYRSFVSHVWSYEDNECGRLIQGPPWVFSMLFDDPDEVGVVFAVIEALVTDPSPVSPSRIEIVTCLAENGGDAYSIQFADLQVLHMLLMALAARSSLDLVGRQVCEFLMWTLGFRWV